MYAKIANRKKKHKIFANYFPAPAAPTTMLFVCLALFADSFCGGGIN